MTDTTDIKALIDDVCLAAAGIHNLGRSVSDDRAQGVIDFIRSKLEFAFEAERQRADTADARIFVLEKGEKYWFEEFKKAVAEIAALKGDQMPVGFTSESALDDVADGDTAMFGPDRVVGRIPLFTAPQKPVEHPDTRRMDWLCAHTVQVRDPMFYGSHAMFWSQCDSDDCEEHHTKLREQVDAAIEAAGGIVKDGE